MGNRLSKIYTRTGDDGTSGLSGGQRVPKNHLRMHAMGSVDELNSIIGLMLCKLDDEELIQLFVGIQHDLFNIGGEISMPEHSFITASKVTHLEAMIDQFNETLKPLKDFILPGGSEAASLCHVARAISRRAERDIISLHQSDLVNESTRHYINRLSDLLFVTARRINQQQDSADILWKKELS